MSTGRKVFFALVTLLFIIGTMEGAARIIWWRLESRAFDRRKTLGEDRLRDDSINYKKVADGTFGYVLKAGFSREGSHINSDGFPQRDEVPLKKRSGVIRLAALGESTTEGHHVDNANYPVYLRRLGQQHGIGYAGVEMINGGVSGWMSDQVALWAEKKISLYRPDIVVLYVGWNDFQTYDPFIPPPGVSYFDQEYGSAELLLESSPLKLTSLASATYRYFSRKQQATPQVTQSSDEENQYFSTPELNYRFYLQSLDRITAAFRSHDPAVRIAIATLVGRWPDGSLTDYNQPNGAIWWMHQNGLNPTQAEAALRRFNDLIRRYAQSHGLFLIDADRAFADVDRSKLQWDFAHMTPEGYELLAEVMFDQLREARFINASPSPRLGELRGAYQSDSRFSQRHTGGPQ